MDEKIGKLFVITLLFVIKLLFIKLFICGATRIFFGLQEWGKLRDKRRGGL